jgi:hypothetical protein
MSSDPRAPGSDNADRAEKDGVSQKEVEQVAAKWGIPEDEAKRMLRNREIATDGGLDADTVKNSVAPGDVVEVATRPYRVVDVEGDVLRLYDLVERTETVKDAGAGDVDAYVHRSETDVIDERVREERERRDVQVEASE